MKYQAFTLLELLVTLTIITLLLTLTIPLYTTHLMTLHRQEAKVMLLTLAQNLEQYYVENHTYEKATIGQNPVTDVLSSEETPGNYYKLQITHQDQGSYSIAAIPTFSQKDSCGTLTYDSLGKKDNLGSKVSVCW